MKGETDPREFVKQAARIAKEDHADDIAVLDLRGISPVTDYFLIATGTSGRQIRTIAEDLKKRGRSEGHRVWQIAGLETSEWVVMDFVDIVVHLFEESKRHFYDLELIWGEAPRVDWEND